MTDRTTPIRAARADAMWSELTDRAEATEYYLERVDARADVPGNADDWRKRGSHMTGILGLLAMYGAEWNTGMTEREVDVRAGALRELDALNVRAVTAHMRREAGWTTRQVDDALNDLAHNECIRLVAEAGGDIRIEVLRPR